jgi:hypothetical protein
MKNILKRILMTLDFWGTPNWYKGVDEPTFSQWLWKWRVGLKTAWQLSGFIIGIKNDLQD